MFDTLYQYLFSSDITVYTLDAEKKTQILLRVGDRVSVFSSRHNIWFDDGVIIATFRECVKVRYGFTRYFGVSLSRGNEKYVYVKDFMDTIRPHKLQK